jgi:hypothetical protein
MYSGASTFSSAVMVGIRWKDWKTTPISSLRRRASLLSGSALISIPSMYTCPPEGRSIPARIPSSVELSEPEGPLSASQVPASTSKEIPLRMCSSRPPCGKWRVTFSARMIVLWNICTSLA